MSYFVDRRPMLSVAIMIHFTRRLILAVIFPLMSASLHAETAVKPITCTLILDAMTGKELRRDGTCNERFTPASTFKVPLALMGYDAAILKDAHDPAWNWRAGIEAPERDHKKVDPTIWERDSVLWYSREVTQSLGYDKFAAYVKRLGYGNQDVSGDKNKSNGLTHSWLSSSLKVSADEQAHMILDMLSDRLSVSKEAQARTRAIVPVFDAPGGWQVHGKTGSIWLRNKAGGYDRNRPIGWFVGWAEKGSRRIVFSRLEIGIERSAKPKGPAVRALFLKELSKLMDQ
jgi:beta-lactamase class D